MTCHYPHLGSASDWLNIFFIQIEEGVLFIHFLSEATLRSG